MEIEGALSSCGMFEIQNLNLKDFKDLLAVKPNKYQNWLGQYETEYLEPTDKFKRGYLYIFSDNRQGAGQAIADYIKKHKLGLLVATRWAKNPNSGQQIRAWIWRCNGKVPNELKKAA